jgi:cytochrome b6-f complex iron-sulfur subunit
MDDSKPSGQEEKSSISRRYFLELVGIGSVVITAVGSAILSVEYLSPNVLHEPPLKFKAGPVEDFPSDSVTLIVDQKAYIVRAKEGYFYAMSAVCTHLGCITGWKADEGIIACPCHGSRYDKEGNVIGGPAPRPLPHFQLTLGDQTELVVDKGEVVAQDVILKI